MVTHSRITRYWKQNFVNNFILLGNLLWLLSHPAELTFIYSDDNNRIDGHGEFGPSFATIPAGTTSFSYSESSSSTAAAAFLTNEDMFETADMVTTALLHSEK